MFHQFFQNFESNYICFTEKGYKAVQVQHKKLGTMTDSIPRVYFVFLTLSTFNFLIQNLLQHVHPAQSIQLERAALRSTWRGTFRTEQFVGWLMLSLTRTALFEESLHFPFSVWQTIGFRLLIAFPSPHYNISRRQYPTTWLRMCYPFWKIGMMNFYYVSWWKEGKTTRWQFHVDTNGIREDVQNMWWSSDNYVCCARDSYRSLSLYF